MNGLEPLVGVDVGSAAVTVVVAIEEEDRLVIRGCGQARHDGARKGVIANLAQVAEAVQLAAEEAEAMATLPVEEAVVGLGGESVLGRRATASVPVTGRGHTVSTEDQRRALEACAQVAIPADYRVLDIIPCGFALDGQGGMDQPLGMPGTRLDASAFVLYTHRIHADTVEQAVNHGSVAVRRLIYEPLAAAEAVLAPDERDLGCLLVDIGHGTTEWVLFTDGSVTASGAVGIGGRHFTSDLAAMLKTTTAAAERVKRTVGARLDREGLEHQAVEVPALGGEGHQVRPAAFVADVLHWRARELLIGIHQSLVRDALERLPRAGVVLTGGGARLEGIEELAEQILGHRVRIGCPRDLAGVVEPVAGPEWAVACGLVRIQQRRREYESSAPAARGGVLSWLRGTLGEFFELGGGT